MELLIDIASRLLAEWPLAPSVQAVCPVLLRSRCQGIVDRRRLAVRRLVAIVDLRELFARSLRFALPVPHTGIKPAGSQKLRMGSALGDLALVEHDDLVGGDDGGKP